MCQHSQLCKLALADDDNDWEKESVDDDNGKEYDKFTLYKD